MPLPEPPLHETGKARETSPDRNSRDARLSEMPKRTISTDASTQTTPAEMSAQTKSETVSQSQSLETWLRAAPTSLTAMLQQGNIEDTVRLIREGLSKMMPPQETGGASQGYAAGGNNNRRDTSRSFEGESGNHIPISLPKRSKSSGDSPSKDSAPFQEEHKGHASEQSHPSDNNGWNFNTVTCPSQTPSPFQRDSRVNSHERNQSFGSEDTAYQGLKGLQMPATYTLQPPSPSQNEYKTAIPEEPDKHNYNESYHNVPAPPNIEVSTKYPDNGHDAFKNGANNYPWSPPQSPTFQENTTQDHNLRTVGEPVANDSKAPLVYDHNTEEDRFFGYKYGGYFAEPSTIRRDEKRPITPRSQDPQPTPMAKNTSTHGPGARNNDVGLGHKRVQFSKPSQICSNKGPRSPSPMPKQRPPPLKAMITPVRQLATKDSEQSLAYKRLNLEPSPMSPSDRRRSITPSQGRKALNTVTSNREPCESDLGPLQPNFRPSSRTQTKTPRGLRRISSQIPSKISEQWGPRVSVLSVNQN
jgi:hypothetical protein